MACGAGGGRSKVHSDSAESFVLQRSDNYTPLRWAQDLSKFSSFGKDPVLAFPIVSSFQSTEPSSHCVSPVLPFQRVSSGSLRTFLQRLQESSPFRRGPCEVLPDSSLSESMHQGHLNSVDSAGSRSIELESFHSPEPPSFSQELVETSQSLPKHSFSDISQTAKEMIQNIQKRYASQHADSHLLHSLTPASTLLSDSEDSPQGPCPRIFDSQCSLLRENVTEESVEGKKIGVLTPEIEGEESKAFYKSTEALKKAKIAGVFKSWEEELSSASAEEGIPSLPTLNFFSNGETASKNLLARSRQQVTMHQIQPKVLLSTTMLTTINESLEVPLVEWPDGLSPIYRKIVVCEEGEKEKRSAEAVDVWPCTGFTSCPSLLFSNLTCTAISPSSRLTSYLTSSITYKLLSHSVAWLSCGFEHCALVTGYGQVYTWGYGASGCLGHGDTNSHAVPRLVQSLSEIQYIDCGGFHTAVVSEKGELWTWGRADVHQLGLPAKRLLKDDMGYVALVPTRVDEFVKRGKAIRGVACGEAHTLALDSDGRLYSFGWAEDGQLGLPLDRLKDGQMSFEIGEIPALRKQRVVKVAAGALFSACLTEEGRMYIWGNGEQGQLGLGSTIKKADLPTLQQALKEEVLDLICGENSVICITKSGKAHGWGQGVAGHFSESTFEPGTDLVSYVPKLLASVDIAHRLVVPKREEKKRAAVLDFNQALSAKLLDLQDYEDSA